MGDRLIQAYPEALIQLLNVKGQEPFLLSDKVAGVIDVTAIFAAQKRKILTSPGTSFSGPGSSVSLTVPAGQTWIVEAISAAIIGQVTGDQFAAAIAFDPNGLNAITLSTGPTVTTVSATEIVRDIFVPPKTFVANAGDRISAFAAAFNLAGGGANRTGVIEVMYTPIGPSSF